MPASPKYAFRRPVDYCSGALLFTPRALFAELGGFDERFLPAYYEDTDYCFKVWEKGRKVIYEPRAAVHHYESASMQNSEAAAALIADHQTKFVEKWKSKLRAPASAGRCVNSLCSHRRAGWWRPYDLYVRSRAAPRSRAGLRLCQRLPHPSGRRGSPCHLCLHDGAAAGRGIQRPSARNRIRGRQFRRALRLPRIAACSTMPPGLREAPACANFWRICGTSADECRR